MSNKAEREKRLAALAGQVAVLGAGAERVKLDIAMEELRSRLEPEAPAPWLEWIKVVGTIAVSLGAVWTLYRGVVEYGAAAAQQDRAPFLAALNSLSDPSAASRAASLMTINDYVQRQAYQKAGRTEQSSPAQKVVFVLGFRLLEEPSALLRQAMLEIIYSVPDGATDAMSQLLLSNAALTGELRASAPEAAAALSSQQRISAWAIGEILRNLSSRQGAAGVSDALDEPEIRGRHGDLRLAGADFSGIDFGTADLSGMDFSDTNLARTDLSRAKLDKAALASLCAAQHWETVKTAPEGMLATLCSRR